MFELCFASVWGSNIDNRTYRSPRPAAPCLVVPLPMALLSLPQTVLAFRFLWLSRLLRLKQAVPAQICHRRLVCQACVPLSPFCLPYSPFVSSFVSFLLPVAAAWFGLLAPPLKTLEFYCSDKNAKACGYQKNCQETLGGQSPKI